MNIIDAAQGSQQWLDIRAKHFTASEAPAMMGASKYTTRSELLRQKATGITEEVDAGKQRLFDRGHAAEAAARPIVEDILGCVLAPLTGSNDHEGLPLLASFDGFEVSDDFISIGTKAWESKLWNATLADAIRAGQLEPHYYWQLEQQLLVSGAEKVYFTTSDGTPENTVGMWYASVPERRAQLIAGWKQFSEDLANHKHVETAPAPVAATIEALPALFVQVEGKVLATNLDAFKAAAQTFIDGIKTELVNDQDFADADKMVKFLKDGEERLALAKSQALAQTFSIDELFRTVDAIGEQMRTKRLALGKLVEAEKSSRKAGIVTDAMHALIEHVTKLNQRIGGNWMPPMNGLRFADAIKGLKSLDSMRDKVAGALANAKIEANEIADRIEANRKALGRDGDADVWMFLFPDFSAVCAKAPDDFDALVAARIAKHNEAQAAKDKAAKEAEDARVAAAVEAERKAGEARAAAAVEAERMAEAKRAAEQAAADQRGKAAVSGGPLSESNKVAQAVEASTPPITAAQAVAARNDANDEAVIDDFLVLLAMSATEKKALRVNILKWEKYRTARLMQVAA
jgi:putative phage-type endonuclease